MPHPSVMTKSKLSWTKYFLSQTKIFVPCLEAHICLEKGQNMTFQLLKKYFPQQKSHFQSISQAIMYFFSLGQNLLSGTKLILSGKINILSGKKITLSGQKDGAYVFILKLFLLTALDCMGAQFCFNQKSFMESPLRLRRSKFQECTR